MALVSRDSFESLHGLLVHKLQLLHDIEQQIIKGLPKMEKRTQNPALKAALVKHLDETQAQVTRLEEALSSIGETAKSVKSDGIRGLIGDAEWVMAHTPSGNTLDATVIASSQGVEDFEIAHYTSAIDWAKLMGHERVVTLLQESLEEEKTAHETLKDLAGDVNVRANTGM